MTTSALPAFFSYPDVLVRRVIDDADAGPDFRRRACRHPSGGFTPPIIARIGSGPGTDLQLRRLHAADHPPPNAPTNGPVPPIISDKTFRPTPAVPRFAGSTRRSAPAPSAARPEGRRLRVALQRPSREARPAAVSTAEQRPGTPGHLPRPIIRASSTGARRSARRSAGKPAARLCRINRRRVALPLPAAGIGVARVDWFRLPLPPNRTGGSPASGFPVGGLTAERIDRPPSCVPSLHRHYPASSLLRTL